MHTIHARNVNDALHAGLMLVHSHGIPETSRNGPVLRVPEPVATVYARPCERVLIQPWRDANPFFHLVEAFWMLAGRDDLRQLTPYVSRMREFSDDGGVTQPGAYGKRWRDHVKSPFLGGIDQLSWVAGRLREDPSDRRCVIQMWDASVDIHKASIGGNDAPCNLTATPYVAAGALHLAVFCRSNDIIWGAYGANAVHFSVLLEYLAARVGVPVGTYTQVSINYHAYLSTFPKVMPVEAAQPYSVSGFDALQPIPMFSEWLVGGEDRECERIFQEDLRVFFEEGPFAYATAGRIPFMRRVLVPMCLAHQHWRTKKGEDRYLGALEILRSCAAPDWRRAAEEWVGRRYDRWKLAADDGAHDAEG